MNERWIASEIAGAVEQVFVRAGEVVEAGEPGERVSAGTQVARVVGTELLRGLVRVPESYASRVVIDQPVVATVLNVPKPARVTRVDPAVTQNSVAVDIAFEDELPVGARPDLSIRATITVAELDDVLFVRRPLAVREDSTNEVYRLAEDRKSASRTVVRFGMGTLRRIEVLDGLDESYQALEYSGKISALSKLGCQLCVDSFES